MMTNRNGTTEAVVDEMVAEMQTAQAQAQVQDDGPQPVFDFTNLSFSDSSKFAFATADFMRASASGNREKIEAALADLKQCYASVLVSVPREWLVKEAPKKIDWSDPESINWLLAVKAGQLRLAYNQQFTEASKN